MWWFFLWSCGSAEPVPAPVDPAPAFARLVAPGELPEAVAWSPPDEAIRGCVAGRDGAVAVAVDTWPGSRAPGFVVATIPRDDDLWQCVLRAASAWPLPDPGDAIPPWTLRWRFGAGPPVSPDATRDALRTAAALTGAPVEVVGSLDDACAASLSAVALVWSLDFQLGCERSRRSRNYTGMCGHDGSWSAQPEWAWQDWVGRCVPPAEAPRASPTEPPVAPAAVCAAVAPLDEAVARVRAGERVDPVLPIPLRAVPKDLRVAWSQLAFGYRAAAFAVGQASAPVDAGAGQVRDLWDEDGAPVSVDDALLGVAAAQGGPVHCGAPCEAWLQAASRAARTVEAATCPPRPPVAPRVGAPVERLKAAAPSAWTAAQQEALALLATQPGDGAFDPRDIDLAAGALEAIRAQDAEARTLRARAPYAIGEVLVRLHADVQLQFEPGDVAAATGLPELDAVGRDLGVRAVERTRAELIPGTLLRISYDAPVDPTDAAARYRASALVQSAGPNGMSGDGPAIRLDRGPTSWTFTFEDARGDCPAGCPHERVAVWSFDPRDGAVTSLWRRPPGAPTSAARPSVTLVEATPSAEAVLHRFGGQLAYCWESWIELQGPSEGELRATFRIEGGRAVAIEATSELPGSEGLGECSRKKVARWTFEGLPDGPVSATWKLGFEQ